MRKKEEDAKKSISGDLLAGVIGNAIFSLLSALLGWWISFKLGFPDQLTTIVVTLFIILTSGLYFVFRTRIMTYPTEIGKKYMSDQTGIEAVFANFDQCAEEMKEKFTNARQIRILLQIGRREIGDGESSVFAALAKEKNKTGDSIRVLRASANSPFLSAKRAKARRNSIRRWHEYMRRLENEIQLLKDVHGAKIDDREHTEPYLWRIFLFDDVAYVSGYLYQKDNDKKASVYRLANTDNSLYRIFDKYFEYLWAKNDPKNSANALNNWAENT